MEITEKQKEYVLTHYGIVDTKIIALHLNTTPEYVRTIANRYGIKIKRQWTKEDMDYLRENWGETSLKVMSKKLKKTEIAIRTKAGREGLGGYIENGSYITLMDLARAIDRDKYESTYRKLINANIPFYIKKVQYKKVKVIGIGKFWRWAEKNKEKLNFSNNVYTMLKRSNVNIVGELLEIGLGFNEASIEIRDKIEEFFKIQSK